MKSFFLSATAVALLLSLYVAADVTAQQRSAAVAAAPSSVAVIDISYVFKHHRRFQAMMEGMKKDVEAAETKLKKERDVITKEMEVLKDLKQGTQAYNAKEEEITHKQAEFNAVASLQKKEFLERESKIYMQVYREVSDAVKYHADAKGFTMVLRFNGDDVDPNNRESVLRDINKPIVYNQPNIDITPVVLDDLNRTQAPSPRRPDDAANRVVVPPKTR